jgi:hypothetical protein
MEVFCWAAQRAEISRMMFRRTWFAEAAMVAKDEKWRRTKSSFFFFDFF